MKNTEASENLEDKRESMRKKYNQTASYYDQRYKLIQYLKYALLLPKIASLKLENRKVMISFPGLCLDHGAGTMLLQDFLGELHLYLYEKENRNGSMENPYRFTGPEEIFFMLFLSECSDKIGEVITNRNEITYSLDIPITIASDISFGMLSQGKSCPASVYCSPLACDLENSPFRNETFNYIFSFTCIQNLNCMEAGLMELIRIAYKEAAIAISVLDKQDYPTQLESVTRNVKIPLRKICVSDHQLAEKINKIKNNYSRSDIDYFIKNMNGKEFSTLKLEDCFFYSHR